MFDSVTVAAVRDQASLLEVIGDHVKLSRRGRDWVGLCPFHGEKTPSFHVHPDRGFYFCFGCQMGGDALSFVREVNGYSFREAVKHLAAQYGVSLPEESAETAREDARKRKVLDDAYALTAFAQAFFRESLVELQGARCRAYIDERRLSRESVERYALGFAPDRWDALSGALQRERSNIELAVSLGLVGRSPKSGKLYDRFRNRLMFPVRSIAGDVLGFSGRALGGGDTDEKGAKYLNSPESDVYKKGEVVYGLHEARVAIRKAKRVILVEGNVDVVMVAQGGHENVVAPLGTALTREQVTLLSRHADSAVTAFDGDSAGLGATRKAVRIAMDVGLPLIVAQLGTGSDPDAAVRSGVFDAVVDAAVPGWEWLVGGVCADMRAGDSAQGAQAAIAELMPMLDGLKHQERALYAQSIARALGQDVKTVLGLAKPAKRSVAVEAVPVAQVASSVVDALAVLVTSEEARALWLGRDAGRWVSGRAREVCEAIASAEGSVSDVLPMVPEAWRSAVVRRMTEGDEPPVLESAIRRLQADALGAEVESLRRRVAACGASDKQGLTSELFKAKGQLQALLGR